MSTLTNRPAISAAAEEIIGLYYPCLDHGFVALLDVMGSDQEVAVAARQSYGAGTHTANEDNGLLRYMKRHRHSSPFEMLEMKFQVRLPIFVARQLIRHRTANVNEYSLRYSLPVMQFYVPQTRNMGTQSKSNKQGRGDVVSAEAAERVSAWWVEICGRDQALYELLIEPEIDLARELARLHLPVNLYTQWTWKLDLNNLMHFLTLRCDSHAQWEIQQYANLKAAMVKRVAPLSFQAWLDYEFQSHTFSRMEMQMLRRLIGTSNTSPGDGETYTPTAVQVMYGEISKSHADALSLSGREWQDFMAAFNRVTQPDRFESMFDAPQFTVDPADGLPAAWYEAATKKFLPKGA
jgi:thymidylate synthase (FAD)